MVMGMVDCVGNELKVGDKVICSDMNYADLLIGEVIGFTPKKIRIKYHRSIDGFDFRKDQLKHPYQVFKYEEVVRCKDCKYSKLPAVLTQKNGKPGTLTCHNWHSPCNKRNVNAAGFCPYGERKDNE
jgi:hypothetical protein